VGEPFTVEATGLPTTVEVDLIVTNYEAPTRSYGPLAVNADGTWSGIFAEPNDGWNFAFVSVDECDAAAESRWDASRKMRIR